MPSLENWGGGLKCIYMRTKTADLGILLCYKLVMYVHYYTCDMAIVYALHLSSPSIVFTQLNSTKLTVFAVTIQCMKQMLICTASGITMASAKFHLLN